MNDAIGQLHRFRPQAGLVLGSGLGTFVGRMSIAARIPFAKAGLPVSRVGGHAGELILGSAGDVRLAVLSGRVHLYEGWNPAEVTAGVRLLAESGIQVLILTNAAGTLNAAFPPGGWMMISDHLNLTGQSPLTGSPEFADMSSAYSPRLRAAFAEAAVRLGMSLPSGVYAGVCGPQYETPAEIRMLRTVGADAVGMSTVLEAIAARAMGLEVAGFSCLTNWAAGIAGPLDHREVIAAGNAAAFDFARLLDEAFGSGAVLPILRDQPPPDFPSPG
jgi:purine-nucleoside phosphorylase